MVGERGWSKRCLKDNGLVCMNVCVCVCVCYVVLVCVCMCGGGHVFIVSNVFFSLSVSMFVKFSVCHVVVFVGV